MTAAELRRLSELCSALRAAVDELAAIIGDGEAVSREIDASENKDGRIKSRDRIENKVTAPNPGISAVDRLNARLRAAFVADPVAPVARRGPRFGELMPPRRRPPSGLPQTSRPAGELEAIEAHIAAKGVTSCPAPTAVETRLEFNHLTRKWRRPTS